MMKLMFFATIFLMVFTISRCQETDAETNTAKESGGINSDETPYIAEDDSVIDLTPLADTIDEMQNNLDTLAQLLEETNDKLTALAPHSVQKRQTTITGRANRDRGHTNWEVGVNRRTRNGWNLGGNVGRDYGQRYGEINAGRTWNNGRTRFGSHFGRRGGRSNWGVSFTHRFRK